MTNKKEGLIPAVRVDPALRERLQAFADADRRTLADFVRKLLEDYCDEIESMFANASGPVGVRFDELHARAMKMIVKHGPRAPKRKLGGSPKEPSS